MQAAYFALIYGEAALVSGGLTYGSKLLWDQTRGQTGRPIMPQLRRMAHISTAMTSHPDVIMRSLQVNGQLSGVAHEAADGPFFMRPFRPLSCAGWTGAQKLDRILDHFDTVRTLGGILVPDRDRVRTLADLRALGDDYRVTIDEPSWMSFDGLTTLSLWKGIDRLFSISFILSSAEGRLRCYIGGLQGRGDAAIRDLYRDMTKEAHGLRPRDLMIELHRMMCHALGTEIRAVADEARFHRDAYYRHSGYGVTSFNYDEAWADRGGIRIDRNWHRMPVEPVRRDAETIPAKKRSLYRQRYALLDLLELEMKEAVARMIDGRAPLLAEAA